MAVLGLRFRARALSSRSKRGPLPIMVRGPLTTAASPVAEHRLQTRRLSNCGSRAQPLRSMWDPPRPGPEPASAAPAGRLSTTAPPGKPFSLFSDLLEPRGFPGPRFLSSGERGLDQLLSPGAAQVLQLLVKLGQRGPAGCMALKQESHLQGQSADTWREYREAGAGRARWFWIHISGSLTRSSFPSSIPFLISSVINSPKDK